MALAINSKKEINMANTNRSFLMVGLVMISFFVISFVTNILGSDNAYSDYGSSS